MKILTHWIIVSLMWILISTAGISLYIKFQWENRLQQYEEDFAKYKQDNKAWKQHNRRMASPYLIWQIKYMTGPSKHAFSKDEVKCLQDNQACSKEKRKQLCERLQSFPNITYCKSIEYMRQEFIALNQYMDNKLPPIKPKFERYIQSQKILLLVSILIILIPPIILFTLQKKPMPSA